jgi:hypothetical protein
LSDDTLSQLSPEAQTKITQALAKGDPKHIIQTCTHVANKLWHHDHGSALADRLYHFSTQMAQDNNLTTIHSAKVAAERAGIIDYLTRPSAATSFPMPQHSP